MTQPLAFRSNAASFALFEDPRSRALAAQARRIGPTGINVLLLGEVGTGKALLAQELHRHSGCRGELVPIGHLTTADELQAALARAAGGTLYIDEVGELSAGLQGELVRQLQHLEQAPDQTPPRLIAATAHDLVAAVGARHFRSDLYYRLSVAILELPPLRGRPADILPLAQHFLHRHGAGLALSEAATASLLAHGWPGNIRELENAVTRAALSAPGDRIEPEHLLLPPAQPATDGDGGIRNAGQPLEQALLQLFERGGHGLYHNIEERVFRCAFDFCQGNQLQTAQLLDISRNVLRHRLKLHGML